MGKQIFNIKGMLRDLSPSKTPNDFAYEIRNLRLTAQEDSTMLSLVSEKGNSQYVVTGDELVGNIVGYCTLNQYLVLFVHYLKEEPQEKGGDVPVEDTSDRIYRLTMNGLEMESELLYDGNLGFGQEGVDIEAIGVYENQNVQKVYWIDGVHQPRFINIAASASERMKWYSSPNPFDFVPTLTFNEKVEIEKASYSGVFNAGTIQYILTYYNKNGQQTAAFYQSPINYIAPENRGASPEDTVDNSFRIKISNPDAAFDYVRVYSIFRSSENGTPVCRKVVDLKVSNAQNIYEEYTRFTGVSLGTETAANYLGPISLIISDVKVLNSSYVEQDLESFLEYREGTVSYYRINENYIIFVKNRTQGTIVALRAAQGETLSVWKSGNSMAVNRGGTTQLRKWASVTATESTSTRSIPTLEYIDNGLSGETANYSEILYAGGTNIIPATMAQKSQTLFFGNYKTVSISEENKDTITNHSTIHFGYGITPVEKGATGGFYMYHNQLDTDAKHITTFKGGETYYFGVILQNANGAWTEVIPIGSKRNQYYPKDMMDGDRSYFLPVKAYVTFDDTALAIVNNYKAVKVVRLDTIPSVVYQGVLCPTVFSNKRENNAPYCQASWFFRDLFSGEEDTPHKIQNRHNGNIREGISSGNAPVYISEIQGARNAAIGYYDGIVSVGSMSDMDMFIDWNTLTLNSPDIEFGSKSSMNYKMRIVGILPITSGRTSMMFSWSTPPKASSIVNHNAYNPIIHNALDTEAYEIDLNVLAYKDAQAGTVGAETPGTYLYPVYPWHRNGSLTAQGTPTDSSNWYALLDTKVMASMRESAFTKYLAGPQYETYYNCIYEITKMSIYQDDEAPLLLEEDPDNFLFNGAKVYLGSIDTALTPSNSGYTTFGIQEGDNHTIEALHSGNKDAVRMKYKSTKHGVFSLKSASNLIFILPNVTIGGTGSPANIGQLAQISPKALIKAKLTPSSTSSNANGTTLNGISNANQFLVGDVVKLTGNSYLYYVKQVVNSTTLLVKALDEEWITSHTGGDVIDYNSTSGSNDNGEYWTTETYKVYFTYDDLTNGKEYYYVAVSSSNGMELDPQYNELVPFYDFSVGNAVYAGAIPTDQSAQITQYTYDVSSINSDNYAYMYIAELYTNDLQFNYEDNPWYVASEPEKTGKYGVEASIGDTYYQRYDCLKTYPYALEDQNQIVEIFSFMCETKINIDGRYDSRRGAADNTSVTGTNFNLLNKAYTQDDNFFTYHYLDPDDFNIDEFPNQLIWTMTKVYGSDIDAWTQIVPTSTLDMDGSLGEVRALRLWNDNLLCFQDMGIAKIMYNERTTMSTEQGIPVEIANSGKVDGSQYLSNSIGCKNKESIKITQEGIYFIDSNTREIYRFSKGLESLSKGKGFNTYMQGEVDLDTEKTFYDPKLKDVYFRFNRKIGNSTITECLVFNEQLGEFTSFFDYDMDFLFPFKDSLVAVEHNSHNLWKQFDGDSYLRYFGQTTGGGAAVYKNYSVQLVSADNPLIDKIFTGLEFRADVISGSIADSHVQVHPNNTYASANALPFQTIQVWNEYQDTGSISFQSMMRASTNLSQKFRIWRGEIGRDSTYKLDRIRSPWARIKLTGGGSNLKTVIHDVTVAYM